MIQISMATISLSVLGYKIFGASIFVVGGFASIVFLVLGIKTWCNHRMGEEGQSLGDDFYNGPTLNEIKRFGRNIRAI